MIPPVLECFAVAVVAFTVVWLAFGAWLFWSGPPQQYTFSRDGDGGLPQPGAIISVSAPDAVAAQIMYDRYAHNRNLLLTQLCGAGPYSYARGAPDSPPRCEYCAGTQTPDPGGRCGNCGAPAAAR